jgi:hypothetical protein
MKTSVQYALAGLLLLTSVQRVLPGTSARNEGANLARVYQVNKRVCDFLDKEDLSTPETTYVAANRLSAAGQFSGAAWQRISIKGLADGFRDEKKEEVKPEIAKMYLNAKILEVRIFKSRYAAVIAELTREDRLNMTMFDMRVVHLENGKWLNAGQGNHNSLDRARLKCLRSWSRYLDKPVRRRIKDPDEHLKPFVDFLKTKGEEPRTFVMNTAAKNKVVIMGETHHRPTYWAFNSSLVAEPGFAKHVGTIYMELPSNDQHLIDKFLAARECDTTPVIEMLRDMLHWGWPDQPMLDFFITVWMVNQDLEPKQRLRIVLADMQRPWKEIQERKDWRKYDVDRDRYMAENILRDIREHPDEKRNALLVVGVAHTGLNLNYFEGSPLKMAGWHLREELGADNVYAIFQHRCRMTNMGRVTGRLCLGLFDSAFAAIGNKAIAFPLDVGPFGNESFDAFPDLPAMASSYRDGYNAYLYLGPLETEMFSPLIAGFYTDEFVKELDRRMRVMKGKGLAEAGIVPKADAKSFIGWMSNSWGKPREWRSTLGPTNAWHYGDKWEEEIREAKHKHALEHSDVIRKVAKDFFEEIRTANYERYNNEWQNFPLWQGDRYQVRRDGPGWVRWICNTFKVDPIRSVELGKVFKDKANRPAIPYTLTLKDGRTLEGDLPFEYEPRSQYWEGIQGVDWHLQD